MAGHFVEPAMLIPQILICSLLFGFDCYCERKATIKPHGIQCAFLRMLTSKLSIQTLVELSINDAVVTGVTGTRGIDIYLLLEEGNGYLLPIPTEPYISPRIPS